MMRFRKRRMSRKEIGEHYRRYLLAILEHAHDNDCGFKVYNIAHAGIEGRISPWVKYPQKMLDAQFQGP